MQCKYIKLSNGDDIIAQTEDLCDTLDDKEFINITHPVLISPIRFPRGVQIFETYIMKPWIKMAKYDIVHLPTRNIIVVVDVDEHAEDQYMKFVDESAETPEYDTDNYDNNFEEQTVEDLFNSLGSENEEEEDDGQSGTTSTRRTFH